MDETVVAGAHGPVSSIGVASGYAFVSVRAHDGQENWSARRAACLEQFAVRGISIEMLDFMPSRMRFVVPRRLVARVRAVVRERDLALRLVPDCAKICLAGSGIPTTAGLFYRALSALTDRGIPLLHFSDSSVTMTLIVSETDARAAERLLHELLAAGNVLPFDAAIGFDATLGRVNVGGKERRLGARQSRLLQFLLDNAGSVVEPEEAARSVFGSDGKQDVAALRVHLHNLRKKIEDEPNNPRIIVTVPAKGYLFVR